MVREIEFRAYIKNIKKIVSIFNIDFLQETIDFMNPDDTQYTCRKFNEIELMQYTGLKDKNGTKIFEGDIVGCFCNTQIFQVKWCDIRGGYFLDDVVMCGGSEPEPECLGNLVDTIEVIGNVFDNGDWETLKRDFANAYKEQAQKEIQDD